MISDKHNPYSNKYLMSNVSKYIEIGGSQRYNKYRNEARISPFEN